MNILILAAGASSYELHDGDYPLCMTEFNDMPLLEHLVRSCKPMPSPKFIFSLNQNDIRQWHLDNIVKLIDPSASLIQVPEKTSGAACTALLGISHIDNDDELLIISANQVVDADLKSITDEFRAKKYDAATIIFDSIHPRYSYVRLDEKNQVIEAAEKLPISRYATAGIYWYAKGSDFVWAAKSMISKDASVDGKFYICPTFNEMILKHATIGVFHIDHNKYFPLKTERQIQLFENKIESVKNN